MPALLPDRAFGFGPFILHRMQKQLLEDGRPVRLGSRALDLLVALVERAGEVVSREELVAIVWPRTVVEESSLRVHIAALRKVLGDGQPGARYIVNQPGRGYSFVAPTVRIDGQPDAVAAPRNDPRLGGLPAPLTRMIGRAESVALLAAQLKFGRFVTIVGPGGIGKTTMALAVADAQDSMFEHGVCYIDLAPLANGQLISSVLMAALGMSPRAEGLGTLETFLGKRRLLIVFDNCEHVIEPLTPLVERLLKCAPGLHVLATSREPMRAEGEWLHRLGAMAAPPPDSPLSAAEALHYPAIELFVERATATTDDFVLDDRDAPVVSALCQRLDGNPLAIELAAARVDLFGLHGLAAQLDAHVLQLVGDRRDAPTRHHSLATMLDWSYQLLSDTERSVLNRLANFQGWFPLQAAADVVRADMPVDMPVAALGADQVLDAIANLAAKSLLISDTSGEVVQFRLLELTRAFALAQLDRLGQRAEMADRHAAHVLTLVESAARQWTTGSKRDWYAAHLWLVDEMRSALAWCFTPQGDALTGARLTAAMWSIVNVINPFDRPDAVERALAALQTLPERHPALELRMNIALAAKYELVEQRTTDAIAVTRRALELAAQFDNAEFEAEALMTVVLTLMAMASYQDASTASVRLGAAARKSGSPALMLVSDRIDSQVSHFVGDNARCRRLAERVLNHPLPRGPMGTIGGGLDHRVSMRIMLSRTLWIEGFADQAALLAEQTLAFADDEDLLAQTQAYSLCVCPVSLWRGDRPAADRHIGAFRALVDKHGTDGVWLPTSALIPWWSDTSIDAVKSLLQRDHLMTAYGRFVSPEAAARADSGAAGWCAAELLRTHGENLLRADAPEAVPTARALFEKAQSIAASQQALAWELRAATSLARLMGERLERPGEARDLLAPVYRRFTEGFETADLRAAAVLLDGA
ncbi:winged helix-turn-helix domain-containing protein [Paucibacter sp. R3-3]|uniref:Winged helix-turn-helix domain-containing protein n=1 Tax=Roseateles agri TaxID=3098619 RepID=A0ABU5DKV7_9BURK|nr:winged helix-turn-helix domain-containing protein [Paucibacter sp. R3-3]MDY0746371.1 winged helix-turn-helix domain-containing protein [Paucibacter sp. R3-3]